MIDVHLLGAATTALGAVRMARTARPDVIVVRSSLARDDLLRAAGRVRKERPEVQIVAVTGDAPKIFLRSARKYGVTFCVPAKFVTIRIPSVIRLAGRDCLETLYLMETRRPRPPVFRGTGPRGPVKRRARPR